VLFPLALGALRVLSQALLPSIFFYLEQFLTLLHQVALPSNVGRMGYIRQTAVSLLPVSKNGQIKV